MGLVAPPVQTLSAATRNYGIDVQELATLLLAPGLRAPGAEAVLRNGANVREVMRVLLKEVEIDYARAQQRLSRRIAKIVRPNPNLPLLVPMELPRPKVRLSRFFARSILQCFSHSFGRGPKDASQNLAG